MSFLKLILLFPTLWRGLALCDGLCNDPGDLLGGGEIGGEPVLGQGERDACRCVGVREASPYSPHPDHTRALLRIAPYPANRVTKRPRDRVAHDLVHAAERRGGDITEPLWRDQPDAVHLIHQRGEHSGRGPGGCFAAGWNVGHQYVAAVAKLGGRGRRPWTKLEERRVVWHRGEELRAAFQVLQPGEPAELGFGHTEVEFISNAERSGHVLPEYLRDRLACRASYDLPDDVTEGVGMVSGLRPRLPPGLGVGDLGAHLVPLAQVLGRRVIRYARHADCVRQHLPHGRSFFAVGPELRPQLNHGRVVAEEAALDEHVCHGRSRTLSDGVGVERSVRGDYTTGLRIGDTGDCIDYLLALPVDGNLQASLGTGLNEIVDGLPDSLLKVVRHLVSF